MACIDSAGHPMNGILIHCYKSMTERERDKQTDRQRQRETDTESERDRQTDRDTQRVAGY